ncbi:hypothetical protein ACQ4PT_059578 [Festuca glaucescens]
MSAVHGSAQLPPPVARNPLLHDSGLLNSTTFISDHRNETTAGTLTRAGLTIQVSFVFADPPRLSYFCVYCLNRYEIPFAKAPKVVSSVEDTALIQVLLTTEESPQYFLYRARGPNGRPSLDLLPDIHRYSQTEFLCVPLGFVSHDNRKQFVMAAVSYGTWDGEYNLHTIGSNPDSTWSKKLLQVEIPNGLTAKSALIEPTKVIALGGGLLGWVDLWKGMVICDVLNPAAKAYFVPMPKLLPNNNELYGNQYSARPLRDITVSRDYIRCVEFEQVLKLRPTTVPAVTDPWDMDELQDSELAIVPPQEEEEVYDVVGWRLITWYRSLTWNGWRKGSMVHSDDLGIISLPQLGGGSCPLNEPFKNLKTASPTLSDDDVVYLLCMLQEDDQAVWIATVDTRSKSVGEVVPFSAEGTVIYDPTFIPCVLSKYLDAKSDGAQGGKRNASHVPHSRNISKWKKQRQHLSQAELEEQQPLPRLLQHSSGNRCIHQVFDVVLE